MWLGHNPYRKSGGRTRLLPGAHLRTRRLGALFEKQLRRHVEAQVQLLDVGFRKIAPAVENFGNDALSAEYFDYIDLT